MSAETQLMWPDEENIFNPDRLLLILSFYQKGEYHTLGLILILQCYAIDYNRAFCLNIAQNISRNIS